MARAVKPAAQQPQEPIPTVTSVPPDLEPVLPGHVVEIEEEPQICATCAGWAQNPRDTYIGQCLPSSRALPAPMITTDNTTCGRWKPRT